MIYVKYIQYVIRMIYGIYASVYIHVHIYEREILDILNLGEGQTNFIVTLLPVTIYLSCKFENFQKLKENLSKSTKVFGYQIVNLFQL